MNGNDRCGFIGGPRRIGKSTMTRRKLKTENSDKLFGEYLGHKEEKFRESERAAKETFALPVYPKLNDAQAQYIAKTIEGMRIGKRSKRLCNLMIKIDI